MTAHTLSIAAAVLTLAAAGQAQAATEWRFPYKGAPYAAPHDHGKNAGQSAPAANLTKYARKNGAVRS